MELTARQQADAVVLPLQGRIDHMNAQTFAQALQPYVAACRSGGPRLVFDLSGLEYISSAGLRVFMLAAKQAAPAGGRIALAAPQAVVREILEISRFNLVFPLHDSLDEALAAGS
ncbi:MAG TPA: STAS domain-containing protein [Solimonas sp.]|nr:STAS domain-containing protein [Solimonas sp.]